MLFPGSGFRDKMFLSQAQVLDPGCVSFADSGFRARVFRDCARTMDLLEPGSLSVCNFGCQSVFLRYTPVDEVTK